MRHAAVLLLLLGASACSKKSAGNYKHCLKLRLGMSQEELLKVMGPPDETIPYVEGKSLPHLKGRTAYEWANPATMSGPNHISVEDASGKVASVRCSDVVVSASVFIEPPALSTAATAASQPAPAVPARTAVPQQEPTGTGAPGRALTNTNEEPRWHGTHPGRR